MSNIFLTVLKMSITSSYVIVFVLITAIAGILVKNWEVKSK